ncbi:MAG: PAS domain S-box protein [Syntrophales bacterium]
MKDQSMTKQKLIRELVCLRQRIAELEQSQAECKRAEGAPQESGVKYRTLLENIPQKIFIKNRDLYYVSVNENYAHDLGIRPDEVMGKSDYDFFPRELADKYRADDQRIMQTSSIEHIEEKYIQDGRVMWVQTIKMPVQDERGEITGVFGMFMDITKRKRAEETLRESEERFSVAFHVNPAPMTISTIDDGVMLDVNDRWLSMLGYARDEMIGQETIKLPIWMDLKARASFIRKFLKKGFLRGESVQLRTKSGEIRDTLWSAEVITYGGREAVLSLLYDITERKRAEMALQKSEERFRFMVETTRDIIYTIDVNGVLTYVNPTAERIMGYSIDELKGKSFEQFVAPECIDLVKDRFKRAMKGESIPVYETDMIRKDGTRLPIEFNGVTTHDSEGKPSGRYGIGRDITERKRTEEKLREAHRRLDEIIEFLPDATFVINADSKVIAWNRAIEQMTGVSKSEMIGKGEYEYALPFYGERRPIFIDLALRPDTQLENGSYDIARRSVDTIYGAAYVPETYGGKGAYLSGGASTLRDAAGNIIGAIESLRDITEIKRAEDELAKYREGLEQLVTERTQDLKDKTKALEELNISLKVLLRHREEDKKELEDRFVMNIKKLIMPFTEKMKRTRLDEQQRAYLSIIDNHLDDITSSLTKRMHQFNFTPREVEVASLLNDGRTTKEIAKIIGIAHSSINSHRNQIRKKLGISRKKVNLRSHLQSFD